MTGSTVQIWYHGIAYTHSIFVVFDRDKINCSSVTAEALKYNITSSNNNLTIALRRNPCSQSVFDRNIIPCINYAHIANVGQCDLVELLRK